MLVLARGHNQSVFIGPHICVKVVRIGKNDVRLGIAAPLEYNIYREELQPDASSTNPAPTVESLSVLQTIFLVNKANVTVVDELLRTYMTHREAGYQGTFTDWMRCLSNQLCQ
jgi:carbon storage regulator CsrA